MKKLIIPTNNGGTNDIPPPVVPVPTPPKRVVFETTEGPVEHPKANSKTTIPYPSRLQDQKLREKANHQMEKKFQIFQELHFDISFADALLLMPKFASTIKNLLGNKETL